MPKIRVLIVDDAVVIRRLVSDCLNGEPDIEVVGTAANGQIGLAKIPQVNPDLVTLDVEMPVHGRAADACGHQEDPSPASGDHVQHAHRARVPGATLDALSLGASDYVTKPANVGSVGEAMRRVREELSQRSGLCRRQPPRGRPSGGAGHPGGAPAAATRGRVPVGRPCDRRLHGRPERAFGAAARTQELPGPGRGGAAYAAAVHAHARRAPGGGLRIPGARRRDGRAAPAR